jgi:hypothetical protein
LLGELEPLHPRNDTFPGEVFLRLAADALDLCRVSRTNPLQLDGLRERLLPEVSFRGRQNKKFQYAVLPAAALHGGNRAGEAYLIAAEADAVTNLLDLRQQPQLGSVLSHCRMALCGGRVYYPARVGQEISDVH